MSLDRYRFTMPVEALKELEHVAERLGRLNREQAEQIIQMVDRLVPDAVKSWLDLSGLVDEEEEIAEEDTGGPIRVRILGS